MPKVNITKKRINGKKDMEISHIKSYLNMNSQNIQKHSSIQHISILNNVNMLKVMESIWIMLLLLCAHLSKDASKHVDM